MFFKPKIFTLKSRNLSLKEAKWILKDLIPCRWKGKYFSKSSNLFCIFVNFLWFRRKVEATLISNDNWRFLFQLLILFWRNKFLQSWSIHHELWKKLKGCWTFNFNMKQSIVAPFFTKIDMSLKILKKTYFLIEYGQLIKRVLL